MILNGFAAWAMLLAPVVTASPVVAEEVAVDRILPDSAYALDPNVPSAAWFAARADTSPVSFLNVPISHFIWR
jgi:hypothetical protein